ncbi:MAG TPA: S4 domain-containing protein, partial [Gemmatimonadaceae bacterium]|nr:S4 domain-containing protein [Gemmatimonadaceae bacterium]
MSDARTAGDPSGPPGATDAAYSPDPAPGGGPGLPREDPHGTTREFSVEADSDVRLDLLVAARLDCSRTQAATLIAGGHVTVGGTRERASYRPRAGEVVRVVVPPSPVMRDVLPENIPLTVVFEDEDLVVVDKPAGMVVHPAP